ncbi:MAG TPA: SDR family NAD(P)-dependent oxidoreductase, partial [Longimicrobiaceae bacterium]|nr:SDR family NAD(P)-dependent oxidoreductase [Longimicrobiaceae bacterium]
ALTHLTKLFLPPMVARGRGRVMNVASTAAFQPGPLMAVYYATKAYVLSFSTAIGVELEGTGVTVTALCPGPTHTGFAAEARMEGSRLFRGGGIMSAAEVAREGFEAMTAGRALVIPGARNRVMAHATRLVPRAFAARLARQAQRKAH